MVVNHVPRSLAHQPDSLVAASRRVEMKNLF